MIINPASTLMRTYITLVTNQTYNFYNPWCTYSPLVPKRDAVQTDLHHNIFVDTTLCYEEIQLVSIEI